MVFFYGYFFNRILDPAFEKNLTDADPGLLSPPPFPFSLSPPFTSSDSALSHVSLAAGHEASHLDLVVGCTHLVGNLSRIIIKKIKSDY